MDKMMTRKYIHIILSIVFPFHYTQIFHNFQYFYGLGGITPLQQPNRVPNSISSAIYSFTPLYFHYHLLMLIRGTNLRQIISAVS